MVNKNLGIKSMKCIDCGEMLEQCQCVRIEKQYVAEKRFFIEIDSILSLIVNRGYDPKYKEN